VLQAVSIARVEIDLHAHPVSHCRAGRLANFTVQGQVKAAVAYWNHVCAASICGFAIDAHQYRKGLTPACPWRIRSETTDGDERFDTPNLYNRVKG
jgi:hypothetical protein